MARFYGVALEPSAAERHFVTEARPLALAAELLALAPDARVTYDMNIAGRRESGKLSAGEYRELVLKTIARQTEGWFTLNEAAQVLADSEPGVEALEAVKRFRLAHSKGDLRIHKGGSRFLMEAGEPIRDFFDLLDVSELDAWLRKSVRYGFPKAEVATRFAVAAVGPKSPKSGDDAWRELARYEAQKIINREVARGRFPPQESIAREIAEDFRKRNPPIHGTDGKPLSGATIKRHALNGISSATKKARATSINRGK